jgi:multiple sugar transport system permease protein
MNAYAQRLARRLRDGTTVFDTVGYGFAILYALVIVIPLYFITVSAFKNDLLILGAPLALPTRLSFENFAGAEKIALLSRAMIISLGVTATSEVLTLLLAFPAAYAIARIRTPLAWLTEGLFSLGFLIPAFAMLLPIFMLIVRLGLLFSPLALVLFYPVWRLSLSVMLLTSFLRSIPLELEESAEIDGASRFQMIRHIFFPLARPGVVTVVVVNFIDIWNEFFFALILLNQDNRTLQVAVSMLKQERLIHYGMLAAGVLLSILPVYIVFIIFQEQVLEGLYAGAVKG